MKTKSLFFRLSCNVTRNSYDNKLCATFHIHIYQVSDWQLSEPTLKVYGSDKVATLKFFASETLENNVSRYQPCYFHTSLYSGDQYMYRGDARFECFRHNDTELYCANTLDRLVDYGKVLSALSAKLQKTIQEYNLEHLHKNCEFGMIVDALHKCGVRQLSSSDGYSHNLQPTEMNHVTLMD